MCSGLASTCHRNPPRPVQLCFTLWFGSGKSCCCHGVGRRKGLSRGRVSPASCFLPRTARMDRAADLVPPTSWPQMTALRRHHPGVLSQSQYPPRHSLPDWPYTRELGKLSSTAVPRASCPRTITIQVSCPLAATWHAAPPHTHTGQ